MPRSLFRGDDAPTRRTRGTFTALAVSALALVVSAGVFATQDRRPEREPIVFSVRGLTCGAVNGLG